MANDISVKRRELAAIGMKIQRKDIRYSIFNRQRLGTADEDERRLERPVKDVRSRQLEAWKRTREEAKKSKPKRKPFIVGTVYHSVGSPYNARLPYKLDSKPKKKKDIVPVKPATAPGRVTRAMSRAAKLNVTVPVQKENELPELAPDNYKFKVPKGIAPLPMPGHKKQRKLKIVHTPFAVEKMEPHVTPSAKTYGKSPKKSAEVPEDDKEFDLLKKTPTFLHSSPTTDDPKELIEGTPHIGRTNDSTPRRRLFF